MPPALTSLFLRLCGAVIGRRVSIRDPVRRVVDADLLSLGDVSFLGPSTLELQVPVRGEATTKPLVQSSSFDLGKARPPSPGMHRVHRMCSYMLHSPCSTGGDHLPEVHYRGFDR